jgi:CDGSH-type Zn-finger protein
MWKAIKEFFGFYESKPKVNDQITDSVTQVNSQITDSVTQVKEPAAVKCGCGRSPSGFCMGLHKMTDKEWAVSDKNPNKVDSSTVVESKPAKKKAVKTTDAAKKPKAKKADAK